MVGVPARSHPGIATTHTQRRSANPAAAQRGINGIFIDDRAARDVIKERQALHQREAMRIDQPFGLRTECPAQHGEITSREQRYGSTCASCSATETSRGSSSPSVGSASPTKLSGRVLKFGPVIARRLRRHRSRPSNRWHLV
jgi:hypothetical protein